MRDSKHNAQLRVVSKITAALYIDRPRSLSKRSPSDLQTFSLGSQILVFCSCWVLSPPQKPIILDLLTRPQAASLTAIIPLPPAAQWAMP